MKMINDKQWTRGERHWRRPAARPRPPLGQPSSARLGSGQRRSPLSLSAGRPVARPVRPSSAHFCSLGFAIGPLSERLRTRLLRAYKPGQRRLRLRPARAGRLRNARPRDQNRPAEIAAARL